MHSDDSLPTDPELPLGFSVELQEQLAEIRSKWTEPMRVLRSAGVTRKPGMTDGELADLAAAIAEERLRVATKTVPMQRGKRWINGRVVRSYAPFK